MIMIVNNKYQYSSSNSTQCSVGTTAVTTVAGRSVGSHELVICYCYCVHCLVAMAHSSLLWQRLKYSVILLDVPTLAFRPRSTPDGPPQVRPVHPLLFSFPTLTATNSTLCPPLSRTPFNPGLTSVTVAFHPSRGYAQRRLRPTSSRTVVSPLASRPSSRIPRSIRA